MGTVGPHASRFIPKTTEDDDEELVEIGMGLQSPCPWTATPSCASSSSGASSSMAFGRDTAPDHEENSSPMAMERTYAGHFNVGSFRSPIMLLRSSLTASRSGRLRLHRTRMQHQPQPHLLSLYNLPRRVNVKAQHSNRRRTMSRPPRIPIWKPSRQSNGLACLQPCGISRIGTWQIDFFLPLSMKRVALKRC